MTWTLVTGGARGLGAEICRFLASRGYDVLVHYRASKEAAERVVESCLDENVRAATIYGDFSYSDGIRDFGEKIPSIKNLVNNVGNILLGAPSQTPFSRYSDLLCINLLAPIHIIEKSVGSIVERKGAIVNIGVAGINLPRADIKYTAYSMSKLALLHYTRSLAKELAPLGVRVNMVSPGQLENSIIVGKIPMRRAGRLEEVARAVEFFLRDSSEYVTGQNMEVSGALTL